jgi:D-methionine transport system ATP-binding protein
VPADWLSRLADQLGSTVSLLGASIETVDGATVGHASIGVTGADPDHLIGVARSLGLDARAEQPAAALPAPAAILEPVA